MLLLSNREANDVANAFLLTLYGSVTFNRWKKLKCRMQFGTESDYVNWVLDVVEHYESEGGPQLNEAIADEKAINQDVKPQYNKGEGHFERKRMKYEDLSPLATPTESGETWTGGDENVDYTEESCHGTHATELPALNNASRQNTETFERNDQVNFTAIEEVAHNYDEVTISSDYSDTNLETTNDISSIPSTSVEGEDSRVSANGQSTSGHPQNYMVTPSRIDDRPITGNNTEKKHQCQYCSYVTKHLPNLRRHIRAVHVRHKKYTCPHCAYSSAREDSVKRHLVAKHHYLSKHSCLYCGKPFSSLSDFNNHTKRCSENN